MRFHAIAHRYGHPVPWPPYAMAYFRAGAFAASLASRLPELRWNHTAQVIGAILDVQDAPERLEVWAEFVDDGSVTCRTIAASLASDDPWLWPRLSVGTGAVAADHALPARYWRDPDYFWLSRAELPEISLTPRSADPRCVILGHDRPAWAAA